MGDLIPAEYRESGINSYFDEGNGWTNLEKAWNTDEFVMDPTRATLMIGHIGMDGDTFKK